MTLPVIEFSEDAQECGADALTLAIGWYFAITVDPKSDDPDATLMLEGIVSAVDQDGWILFEVDGQEIPIDVNDIERMVYL